MYVIVFPFLCFLLTGFFTHLDSRTVEYELSNLSNQEIRNVLQLIQHDKFESILDPILITRVSGTIGNLKVREYIGKFMKDLDWHVEFDHFTDNTPFGLTNFSNVIATLKPNAKRRLLLACHFDSKLNRENTLLTATDSAVPCSMMLALAKDLADLLNKSKNSNSDTTLQFVFFDGEEAFVSWTAKDSLYGARNLAAKWARTSRDGDKSNELDSIEAFVLLDLIGAPNPTFYNQFPETTVLHNRLVTLEKKLHVMELLAKHKLPNQYFRKDIMAAGIEDDHIPFYRRGVPILHLIAVPFPKVWHKESDTKENLDFNVIQNLNKIIYIFVVEYLHLLVGNNS